MGNLFSSRPPVNWGVSDLIERLESVEESLQQASSRADVNGDGIVTRKEMESYLATQLQIREQELDRLNNELDRLQKAYDALSTKHGKLVTSVKSGKQNEISADLQSSSSVDDAAIDKFVQELIDDPDINIYGLPDRIEKAMYKRAAKMTLVGIEKIFDNIALELIGHRVQLLMRPSAESAESVSAGPDKN